MKSCGPVPGPVHSGRSARPAPVQFRERSASPDGVSVERMPSARRTSRTTAMTNTMARACLLLAAAILLLSGCAGPTTTGPAPVPPAQPAPSLPADLPLDADRSDVSVNSPCCDGACTSRKPGRCAPCRRNTRRRRGQRDGRLPHRRRPIHRRRSASASSSRNGAPNELAGSLERGIADVPGSGRIKRRLGRRGPTVTVVQMV